MSAFPTPVVVSRRLGFDHCRYNGQIVPDANGLEHKFDMSAYVKRIDALARESTEAAS